MKQPSGVLLHELRVPDNSQLKTSAQNVVDGLLRICLREIDLNLLAVLNLLKEFRKRVGDVGGSGNGNFHGGKLLVPLLRLPFQKLQLIDDLPGNLQKCLPFFRDRRSGGGSLEYGIPQSALQFFHSLAQAGLGHIQVLRCLVDRTAVRDFYRISHLFNGNIQHLQFTFFHMTVSVVCIIAQMPVM